MDFKQIADKVLGMLQRADGNDPSRGHLTMNNWEWPTGVALYGIYKTYQQSGDRSILDYLIGWYDDMLSREQKPHRNVNTVAPVLTLTCLYEETRNPVYLEHIESWAKWVRIMARFMEPCGSCPCHSALSPCQPGKAAFTAAAKERPSSGRAYSAS